MMAENGISINSSEPANTRWLVGWIMLAILGSLIVLGAGWYGYRSGFDGELQAPRAPSAGENQARSLENSSFPPVVKDNTRGPSGGFATQKPDNALRWPMWEFQLSQPIPPRDPPLTPPGWRLLGSAMTREGWKVAILRQDSKKPELFGLGATLPGGSVIKAISDEDVTLIVDKREVVLSYTGSR